MPITNNTKGQNAVEYMLVFAVVLMVILFFLAPKKGGFMREQVDTSLDLSTEGLECMAAKICYKEGGCGAPCGNGCCEEGESISSCPEDCDPDSASECVRNPSFEPCSGMGACGEGCVWEEVKHCYKNKWGVKMCTPSTFTCNEIPCTGTTSLGCTSQSHCIWR